MKIKQLFFNAIALIVAASLLFTGCRKPKDKDEDTTGAEDNSLADKSFEDMGQISNEAASGGVSSFKGSSNDGLLSACATFTHDTATNKIVVDFGTVNCLCSDGRYRRGKIFISYTGISYWDSLMSVTISSTLAGDPSSNSYFVNDNQVIGTKNITNKGHNSAGHMNWDITVNGQIIKANNQGTILWTSTRNREWIAGEGTSTWLDDVYGVTGTAQGTSPNGTQFNVTITSQLIRKIACPKHFVSGTFDFTPGSKPVRHVDFGYSPSPSPSGSCDGWISVTINGNTYYKQLP